MSRFSLHSCFAGCMLNGYDATLFLEFFAANGWERTDNDSEANLIILNSCAFVKNVEDKVVKKIEELSKNKKTNQKIVLCGCLPKIHEKINKLVDISFGPRENTKLNEIIDAKVKIEDLKINMINREFSGNSPEKRCYIRISEGCLGKCSYCAIKNAKGKLKSVDSEEIIDRFGEGLSKGCNEFVLLGDDVGCYGMDIGTNLAKLLKSISDRDGDYKIFLHFVEPMWFLKLFDELKPVFESGKISLLNLPIQSGNNRILELMKRGYLIEEVMGCVKSLRKLVPGLKIQTHILFGFPTETENEFKGSLLAAKEFDSVKFFAYSDRPKTDALGIEPKIDLALKEQMVDLIKKEAELQKNYVLVQD